MLVSSLGFTRPLGTSHSSSRGWPLPPRVLARTPYARSRHTRWPQTLPNLPQHPLDECTRCRSRWDAVLQCERGKRPFGRAAAARDRVEFPSHTQPHLAFPLTILCCIISYTFLVFANTKQSRERRSVSNEFEAVRQDLLLMCSAAAQRDV